jgi:hypothetical protein
MSGKKKLKAAVSVSEMARMLNLSRSRFYQLMQAGVFPAPTRDADTGRPIYTEGLQRACLEVRATGRGDNGQLVVFYGRRKPAGQPTKAARRKAGQHDDLIAALKALGLAAVTEAQVSEALAAAFPAGTGGVEEAEVTRAVFLRVRQVEGRDPGR